MDNIHLLTGQRSQPARCASAITGTKPAHDTRFESSDDA
jgi:hypothetical protein